MKPCGPRGPNRLEDKSSSTAKFECAEVDQYCYRETIKLDENRVEDCQQQQGRKAIKTTLSCESYRDLATQKLEASEVDKYMVSAQPPQAQLRLKNEINYALSLK
uniref:Uncharacterized protein n=1 Tax=Trichogramma kaykai TaxID=54128 RepID=A0ABD2WYU7_9HYME